MVLFTGLDILIYMNNTKNFSTKVILIVLSLIVIGAIVFLTQRNQIAYGELYVKIHDNVSLDSDVFEQSSAKVNINKLPQSIQNVFTKYGVSNAESMYFDANISQEERLLRVYLVTTYSANEFISEISSLPF